MGCSPFRVSSSDERSWAGRLIDRVFPPKYPEGNPNPYRFEILEQRLEYNFVILKVKYPDAKNYEGEKILVFHDIPYTFFVNITYLDPHFFDGKTSPVARFKPDEEGMQMAVTFCRAWKDTLGTLFT
jgi:hypothetical protein